MDGLSLYGALLEEPAPTLVRHGDGRSTPLPLERYLGPAAAAERAVAQVAHAPALDVGCGPGRALSALADADVHALGLDACPAAVRTARTRGLRAVQGDVFAPVPGAGSWATAILLDGNIGIGGDPVRLLARCAGLLRPGGRIIAEVAPPGRPSSAGRVRLESGERRSRWFPWASVGHDDIADTARAASLTVGWTLPFGGRWFACLI